MSHILPKRPMSWNPYGNPRRSGMRSAFGGSGGGPTPPCPPVLVTDVSPPNGATGVSPTSNPSFDFDQPVQVVSASLHTSSAFPGCTPMVPVDFAPVLSGGGTILMLVLVGDFANGQHIASVTVKNACGQELTVTTCFEVMGGG